MGIVCGSRVWVTLCRASELQMTLHRSLHWSLWLIAHFPSLDHFCVMRLFRSPTLQNRDVLPHPDMGVEELFLSTPTYMVYLVRSEGQGDIFSCSTKQINWLGSDDMEAEENHFESKMSCIPCQVFTCCTCTQESFSFFVLVSIAKAWSLWIEFLSLNWHVRSLSLSLSLSANSLQHSALSPVML